MLEAAIIRLIFDYIINPVDTEDEINSLSQQKPDRKKRSQKQADFQDWMAARYAERIALNNNISTYLLSVEHNNPILESSPFQELIVKLQTYPELEEYKNKDYFQAAYLLHHQSIVDLLSVILALQENIEETQETNQSAFKKF